MRSAFTLLFTSLHAALMIVYQEAATLDPVHLIMTKEEKMAIFGTDDQIPEYHLVQPIQIAKERYRRYLNMEPSNADLMLSLTTNEDDFIMHLNKRSNIARTPLKIHLRDVNEADTRYMLDHPKCLYHGKVLGMENSAVAISTCKPHEMAGIVQLSTDDIYVLAPLPNRIRRTISQETFENSTSHHILYKQRSIQHEFQDNSEKNSFREIKTFDSSPLQSTTKNSRATRQTESDFTIEIGVFVDDVLYSQIAKQHPTETVNAVVNLVCTYVNAMQLIYEQPSLSVSIRFVIVGLTIIKSAKVGPAKGDGDMVDYLKSFSNWQKEENPPGDHNDEHWDHAIILTGCDLYVGSQLSNEFIGMAYVNGMCNSAFSVSICEARHFDSAFILSHEIGHNLGMEHDGKGNTCEQNDFIMSPSIGPGKTTWSDCSDRYLTKYLKTNGKCLEDEAYIANELDHRSNLLPGEKYDTTAQCINKKGKDAKPRLSEYAPFDNVCRELWCSVGMISWFAHPALDGTVCETSKVCFHGECVERSDVMDYLQSRSLVLGE